jgi:hypothetical protein
VQIDKGKNQVISAQEENKARLMNYYTYSYYRGEDNIMGHYIVRPIMTNLILPISK